jgi:hypothetical protein
VASLGVNNKVGGGEDATSGIGLAICSLGGCNGVDSGGGATGSFCEGLRHQLQTQPGAASEREGPEPARCWWRQQSAFLRPRHRGRNDT